MKVYSLREVLYGIVFVVSLGVVLEGACHKGHKNSCPPPPQCSNTLQHDIHKDGPCEDKE